MYIEEVQNIYGNHIYYQNVTVIMSYTDNCVEYVRAELIIDPYFYDMETSLLRPDTYSEIDELRGIYDLF